MLYLQKLEIEALRSIRDKQTIDFSVLGQNTRFGGTNNDTGGDSGAGKSSIPEALDYLLGVGKIPATVLQNRDTKEPINIVGTFHDESDNVIILSRSKKDGLSLTIDGKKMEGLTKGVEEKLDDLLGIPRDLFRKMYHKKQKEGGFFLSLTPKENYQFLMQACGLDEWEVKLKNSEDKVKQTKNQITAMDYELEIDKTSLTEAQDLIEFIVRPEPLVAVDILSLKENVTKLENQVNKLNTERVQVLSKYTRPEMIVSVESEDIDKYRAEITKLKKSSSEYQQEYLATVATVNVQLQRTTKELADIASVKVQLSHKQDSARMIITEIKALEHTDCPTCNQEWISDDKQILINSKKKEIKEIKQDVLAMKDICGKEDSLVSLMIKLEDESAILREPIEDVNVDKIKELTTIINDIIDRDISLNASRRDQYETLLSTYLDNTDRAKSSIDTSIKKLNEEIYRVKTIIVDSETKKKYYDEAVEEYISKKKMAEHKLEVKKLKVSRIEEALKSSNKEMNLLLESKRAIKSYTMKIFQDTLDTIGETASNILNQVPNVQNNTIMFEGFKEQKNGNIKEEITAVLNSGGSTGIDIRSLSGGERTSIDLAVDLAAIEILEDKFNKGLNVFILDEPFEGMDSISKEQYLELIKNLDTNKKLIIIDHSSEVKEMVGDTIIIEKTNGVSRIL